MPTNTPQPCCRIASIAGRTWVAAAATFISVASLCPSAAAVVFVQWDPAQGGNGNFYAAVAHPNTQFGTAASLASSMGGHLAFVSSEAENQFVAQLASAPELWVQLNGDSCCANGPWLGGTFSRGAWRWGLEGPFTYTNWFPGQPANSLSMSSMHYYAEPAGARGAAWNDIAASTLLGGYVVELEAANVNVNTSIRGVAVTGQQAPGVDAGIQFASFSFFNVSMSDDGDVTFGATIAGPGVTFDDDYGFWRSMGSQLQLLHRYDGNSQAIVVNDAGDFSFIEDTVPTANSGVFAQRGLAGVKLLSDAAELRAASGFPASWPEYNGLIRALGINPAGRVTVSTRHDQFQALLSEDGAGNLGQVARDGRPVPGMPANVSFDAIQDVLVNREGHLLVRAALRVGGGFTAAILVNRTPGAFEKIAQEGDPIAGMPGYTYSSLFYGSLSFRDDWAAFSAGAVDSQGANDRTGIWRQQLDQAPRLIIDVDDQPPGLLGAAQFTTLDKVQVNSSGDVALAASFQYSTHESTGLWLHDGLDLQLVAKDGDPAPGRPAGDLISAFDFERFLLSDHGRAAFLATIRTADSTFLDALWAQNDTGELELIAAEGQIVDVDPGPAGDLRVIAALFSLDAFNARGQLAFTASFTDGTRAILASDAVAVPEPLSVTTLGAAAAAVLARRRPRRRPCRAQPGC